MPHDQVTTDLIGFIRRAFLDGDPAGELTDETPLLAWGSLTRSRRPDCSPTSRTSWGPESIPPSSTPATSRTCAASPRWSGRTAAARGRRGSTARPPERAPATMSEDANAPVTVAESREIRLRAGRFHYGRWVPDTDGPPVVLLHGNGDTSATWSRVGPALCSGGMRVVAPDLRGFGASVRPPVGSYGLGDVAADLRELVATLALHRPVLVGHCWGAATALGCATGAFGDHGPPELAGLVFEELPADMASTVEQPAVRDHLRMMRSSREYVEGWVGLICRSWHPVDRASLVVSVCSADEEVYLSVVEDGAAAGPLIPLRARLEVPALVLRGSPDRGVDHRRSRLAASAEVASRERRRARRRGGRARRSLGRLRDVRPPRRAIRPRAGLTRPRSGPPGGAARQTRVGGFRPGAARTRAS